MFREIRIEELQVNPITLFGKDWCVVSAGNETDGYNGMTIAWGHLGSIWDRATEHGKIMIPTVNVYVRPSRYTKTFMDKEDVFTVSAFPKEYKRALGYMGSHSGRNEDKAVGAGLTPVFMDGTVTYEQADLVFVCRKIYQQTLKEECFTDHSIMEENYPKRDFHDMYIGEILKIYVNE